MALGCAWFVLFFLVLFRYFLWSSFWSTSLFFCCSVLRPQSRIPWEVALPLRTISLASSVVLVASASSTRLLNKSSPLLRSPWLARLLRLLPPAWNWRMAQFYLLRSSWVMQALTRRTQNFFLLFLPFHRLPFQLPLQLGMEQRWRNAPAMMLLCLNMPSELPYCLFFLQFSSSLISFDCVLYAITFQSCIQSHCSFFSLAASQIVHFLTHALPWLSWHTRRVEDHSADDCHLCQSRANQRTGIRGTLWGIFLLCFFCVIRSSIFWCEHFLLHSERSWSSTSSSWIHIGRNVYFHESCLLR